MDARKVSNPPETTSTLELIHKLKEEIDALCEKQGDALKTATYLGMSPEEARKYDERRDRITELVKQLELLQSAL